MNKRLLNSYLVTLVFLLVPLSLLAIFDNLLIYVIVFFSIGFFQNALGILMHECCHNFFNKNKTKNDFWANLLICNPIFNYVEDYRREHLEHHKHSGSPKDPYFHLYGIYKTKKELFLNLMMDISGITAFKVFLRRRSGPNKKPKTSSFILLFTQTTIFLTLYLVSGKAWAYIAFWILPLVTIPFIVNRMRSFIEHTNIDDSSPINRSVKPYLFEYLLIAPFGYSYHSLHHDNMRVESFDLFLSSREETVIEKSYLRTFVKLFKKLG
jgi:fatty acid desaturase